MARIRVFSKSKGKIGTIDEKDFSEEEFVKMAERGLFSDEISNALMKISKYAPGAFTTAGGIGGLALGNLPGAALGGFAGGAAGKAVEDMLQDLAGAAETPTEKLEDVTEAYKTGAKSAASNVVAYGVGKALPWLTKKGVAGKAEQAAAKGTDISWEKLSSDIEKEVGKKLGADLGVKKATSKVLSTARPASLATERMISSPATLDYRRQLLNRYSENILQGLARMLGGGATGAGLESKVANVARGVTSQALHQAAPGTKIPDLLYRLYSSGGVLGGDVPALAAKYGIGLPILKRLMNNVGSAPWLMKEATE